MATGVLGVWLGSSFSTHMWLTSTDSDSAESADTLTARILTIFNQFTFTETSTGVVMKPIVRSSFSLVRKGGVAPHIARYIDGLGLVDAFERTPEQEWLVPTAPGERVAGGELWVEGATIQKADSPDDLATDESLTLLLVGDTAIARIDPDLGDVPEASVLERSSSLTVDWKAGAFA